VLVPIAADLAARVARGGLLVLSGILIEEADEVAAAYLAAGLRQLPRRDLGEWCALVFAAGDPA
jgi:ribosomal protein L11 methyltransferase